MDLRSTPQHHHLTTSLRKRILGLRPLSRGTISALIAGGIIACAAVVLFQTLRTLRLEDIPQTIARTPAHILVSCMALTAVSFAVLGCYDAIAARVVAPKRLSLSLAWCAGVMANAISNTLGFHAVTGTAVRYRLYRQVGLGAADVARMMSLSWTTLGFGFASTFALAMLFAPGEGVARRWTGLMILGTMALLVRWMGRGRTLTVGSLSLPLPSAGLASAQIVLGAVEMLAAMGALYVLLPAGTAISFPGFSAVYIGAVLLGIASHAPGGIGVFEATMLGLAGAGDRAGMLGALLLYRLIYNLAPFVFAVSAYAVLELLARRSQLERG